MNKDYKEELMNDLMKNVDHFKTGPAYKLQDPRSMEQVKGNEYIINLIREDIKKEEENE